MLTTLTLPDATPCPLSYESWGDENSQHVLFCVHGLTRNAMDFEKLAQSAVAKGFRVIAPDMPGRGKSPNLANPAFYNNAINANLCLQLLVALGITPPLKSPPLSGEAMRLGVCAYKTLSRVVGVIKNILPHSRLSPPLIPPQAGGKQKQLYWVGTSMGGLIAMLVANQAPTLIRKLVLNDVGCVITAASLARIGEYVGKSPSFATFAEAEQLLRERTSGFAILESDWKRFAETSIVQEAGSFRLAYDPAVAKGFALPTPAADIQLWPLWKAMKIIPTLLIRGEKSDLLTEETARQMQATHPKLTRYNVPNAGHAPALLTEEEIATVLGFLLNQ